MKKKKRKWEQKEEKLIQADPSEHSKYACQVVRWGKQIIKRIQTLILKINYTGIKLKKKNKKEKKLSNQVDQPNFMTNSNYLNEII